nr:immunoglobulin light chain junction region [Macaca mulatta]MOX10980.1 immunoglobulin light chain junction region [Macaca mulatta]
CGQATYLPYTF